MKNSLSHALVSHLVSLSLLILMVCAGERQDGGDKVEDLDGW